MSSGVWDVRQYEDGPSGMTIQTAYRAPIFWVCVDIEGHDKDVPIGMMAMIPYCMN